MNWRDILGRHPRSRTPFAGLLKVGAVETLDLIEAYRPIGQFPGGTPASDHPDERASAVIRWLRDANEQDLLSDELCHETVDEVAWVVMALPDRPTRLIQRLLKPFPAAARSSPLARLQFGAPNLTRRALEAFAPIFRFDYMGAAEFEDGEVGAALRTLFGGSESPAAETVFVQGRPAYYITRSSLRGYVRGFLPRLAEDERRFQLTERAGFRYALENDDSGPQGMNLPCGWLELDNSFLFFADRQMFLKTAELFGVHAAV
jgi:hypothetical protein